MEDALHAANHPHDFKLMVASEGQRSTSVDQLYEDEPSQPSQLPPKSAPQERTLYGHHTDPLDEPGQAPAKVGNSSEARSPATNGSSANGSTRPPGQ
jgi:hypothetical protein